MFTDRRNFFAKKENNNNFHQLNNTTFALEVSNILIAATFKGNISNYYKLWSRSRKSKASKGHGKNDLTYVMMTVSSRFVLP